MCWRFKFWSCYGSIEVISLDQYIKEISVDGKENKYTD